MVPTVAILTNVVPGYRAGFYDRLFARTDLRVDVYCQSHIPGMNIQTIHERYPERVTVVRSLAAHREALAWQFLPWRKLLSRYDVVFVDGNPRILSHALAATLLRMLRRNVVLWTMGHSYASNRVSERIRLWWTQGFSRIFLYNDAEVRALRRLGFTRHDLRAMNNGLDQARIDAVIDEWNAARLEAWRREHDIGGRTLLLSCARLEAKNKLELLMRALPALARDVPDVSWAIVGGGPEADRLAAMARELGLTDRVRFVGEQHDERELAPWFLSADVFVHPGAIGLSLLHAFGYGLPIVTHGNARHHGPEFGAFEEARTGRTFRENDVRSLGDTIAALLRDGPARAAMRQHVRRLAQHEYNVDVMVDRFVRAARSAAGAAT